MAHWSGFFKISFPQKRITFHPLLSRYSFTSASRRMLFSIFLCQKSALVLCSCFLVSQFFPCQNSLSAKTAILYFLMAISGLPSISVTFFLNRIPFFHSALERAISILEPLFRTARMFFLRCSGVSLSMNTKVTFCRGIWGSDQYKNTQAKVLLNLTVNHNLYGFKSTEKLPLPFNCEHYIL